MAAGVIGGIYLGLWVMFVGGIMTIAGAFDSNTLTSTLVAINVIKIILSSGVGYVIAFVGITVGVIVSDN